MIYKITWNNVLLEHPGIETINCQKNLMSGQSRVFFSTYFNIRGFLFKLMTLDSFVVVIHSRCIYNFLCNRLGGVMVRRLASSVVDRGFEPRSGQTKDYKMVFVASPLSTQLLSRKSKD